MRLFRPPLLILQVIIFLFAFLPFVHADRGGFSPIRESVSETGQKTIIAWNGTYEVLMLSTDVSSSKESEVVEIMPLPSNPSISKGEKQPFLKVQDLVNTYLAVTTTRYPYYYSLRQSGVEEPPPPPQITITFQEIIGVHYLTVVKAEETSELIRWLEDFLETQGYNKELPHNLEELLSYYMQNGMNHFVIDMIKTDTQGKTVDPLIYKFKSTNLYYPMRISTLFSGNTEINLFTITNNALNYSSITNIGFVKKAQFQIKQETLAEISANITQLFIGNPYLCYFRFSGPLKEFYSDILATSQLSTTFFSMSLLAVSLGLVLFEFTFLLLPINKIGLSLKNQVPIIRRLKIASISAGLVGIFLTLAGCFLPWGLVGYGKNGEVLISLSGLFGSSPSREIVALFFLAAVFLTPYCLCSLFIKREEEEPFWILIGGGVYLMFQMLISSAYYLYTWDTGALAITVGCSLIILAGLFSFYRTKLTPKSAS
jgi:hypothetical protein